MSEAPGADSFGPRVAAFDARADIGFERLRRSPLASRVFTSASHLGDWSLIWHIGSAVRGLTSESRAGQAFVVSALIGVESLVVNQGVKRLFRRTRPTDGGDDRFPVRRPRTSSFPSGHASAAVFAATVLTALDGVAFAPLWFGLAAVVALSRVFVRIHHASDVVGGAVVGALLGLAALPVVAAIG